MYDPASIPAARPRPLEKLQALIADYVVCSPEQRLVLALWIVQSHCVDTFDCTAYLAITSPQRRCGKTTLMDLLQELVPRPLVTANASEATIFRAIQAFQPTLLFDEIDRILNPVNAKQHEGLISILNSGNRKGTPVLRCEPPDMNIKAFNVYCAKVLAGIGTLPDTITDRSVPMRLQRKLRIEKVKRFRRRVVSARCEPMKAALAKWAEENAEGLADDIAQECVPLPDELNDRAQDYCEPLLAIANRLGYAQEAREALVAIHAGERADSSDQAAVNLLRDIRAIFTVNDVPGYTTKNLIFVLNGGYGWGDYYGRGLKDRDLATLLGNYGIKSLTVRQQGTEDRGQGYRRDDFVDAWQRYLPLPDELEAEEAVFV